MAIAEQIEKEMNEMDIRVFVRGVNNKEELRALALDRVSRGLHRFARRIRNVNVRVEDETGPRKKGIDKVCSIEVEFPRGGDVRVREVGDDLRAVIELALSRVKAAMGREVGKRKRGIGEG